ncbi:hypothetical protein I79_010558 [Cricetulus griseus]|uniref:Uncharacterized protein n=1 Tax=Cricetulus griseus TaxID=10029 RepID=G3HIT1_CRIGR|nr:hypothetical protein I79_010558 [Cricetulus griseus]
MVGVSCKSLYFYRKMLEVNSRKFNRWPGALHSVIWKQNRFSSPESTGSSLKYTKKKSHLRII